MRFSVLSSGSKANVTFLEVAGTKVLIDCGLSAKKVEERLNTCGVSPSSLAAILVTHEHSDHILGVPALSKRYKLPVFATERTANEIPRCYHKEIIERGEEFWIGAARFESFGIAHDAVDPVGYVAFGDGLKFGQATDLGRVTNVVRERLSASHAIVLESNHDQELLRSCDYSWELKSRIASSHGHLSNEASANLLFEVLHADLCHVVLAHLSENSNRPDVALATHGAFIGDAPWFSIVCGSIHEASPLYQVGESKPLPVLRLAS